MKKNIFFSRTLILYLAVATILALFALLNEFAPRIAKKYYNLTFSSCSISNKDSLEILLRKGVVSSLEKKTACDHSLIYEKTFLSYVFSKRKISVYEYGEYGLLLHNAFLYAKKKNDSELLNLVKENFDEGFQFFSRNQTLKTDQVTYGNIAIDLYNEYGDEYYKQIADKIYDDLSMKDSIDGIILYRTGKKHQSVDVIGLVCPFLFSYAKEFNNHNAYAMAEKMVSGYIKHGTDYITGVPAQKYDIKNLFRKGLNNWGRGISWYLMGIMGLESLHDEDSIIVHKLEQTLLQNKTMLYGQYLGDEEYVDMSATIPILYYLTRKGRLTLSADKYIQIISPFVDRDGIVRFCSPSIALPNEKPNAFQTSIAFQSLALLFLLELQ